MISSVFSRQWERAVHKCTSSSLEDVNSLSITPSTIPPSYNLSGWLDLIAARHSFPENDPAEKRLMSVIIMNWTSF
jgi:hypothetical protein